MKVLVIGEEKRFKRYTEAQYLNQHEIIIVPVGTSNDEIVTKAKNARVIIADAIARVDSDLINRMHRLKLIHSEGVAYHLIDLEAARKRGIYVCHCRGFNAKAVAEQAVLLMLGCLRFVIDGHNAVLNGRQIDNKLSHMAHGDLLELGELKVGLVGAGAIAKNVANMLSGFDCEVYYYDINKLHMITEQYYHLNYLPLDELLNTCDIISLHVPVTDDTFHMVDDTFIERMKEGSILINTARGELIDNDALIRGLQSHHIAGAGLDTLDNEPVQSDHPLLTSDVTDRILFSPHIGGLTASAFHRGYKIIWNNIEHIRHHEKPDFIVNM